jgi:type VI secretion system secreted protein Hcp
LFEGVIAAIYPTASAVSNSQSLLEVLLMKTGNLTILMFVLGSLLSQQSVSAPATPPSSTVYNETFVNPYNKAQITINAQKQGAYPVFNAFAITHSIVSPRDPQSGLPTGQRVHKPLSFTKLVNEASTYLFQSLVTNENLAEVVIQYIGINGGLGPKIRLINANIASFSTHAQGFNNRNNPVAGVVTSEFNELEDVELTYQKIEITYGGMTVSDDWEARI